MKYVLSDKLRPPPHPFYGDNYERGPSPWHDDGFKGTPAEGMGEKGPRKQGWFLIDGAGNAIGFDADGTEVELTVQQVRKLPTDLRDELMRQGADVVARHLAEPEWKR